MINRSDKYHLQANSHVTGLKHGLFWGLILLEKELTSIVKKIFTQTFCSLHRRIAPLTIHITNRPVQYEQA
jgi:hypothetical protein